VLKANQESQETQPGRFVVEKQNSVSYFLLDRGSALAKISKYAFRDARETEQKQ
jgi:hypothetical protein